MRQNGRGGLGKLVGGVSLPGTAPIDGVEQLRFHGHFPKLQRGPGGDSVHETEGKRERVSAVVLEKRVQSREQRKGERHGTAVVDIHLLLRQHLVVVDQGSEGCDCVLALLAVHERMWSKGEAVVWSGEEVRAQGGL